MLQNREQERLIHNNRILFFSNLLKRFSMIFHTRFEKY